MALISTLQLAHLPPSITIHASLFRDVRNADFLRQQLLAANAAFEYAFLDARSVSAPSSSLAPSSTPLRARSARS